MIESLQPSTSPDPDARHDAPPPATPMAEEALGVAMLLSAAGGFLDAFTWITHGHVFANTQTGNVVLLAVYAAMGEWVQALRHLPPIIAFVLGVFVARRLQAHASRREQRREALYCLAVEILFLAVVAVLPRGFADLPVVLGIAFVAALQISSFGRVEG